MITEIKYSGMRQFITIIFISFCSALICLTPSCQFRKDKNELDAAPGDTTDIFEHKVEVNYAQGFKVQYHPTYKNVTVFDPANPSRVYGKYILVTEGKPFFATSDATIIQVPLKNIACISTTHLPLLVLLGVEEKLIGFSGTQYIRNTSVLEQLEAGKIEEIGFDYALNKEKIIDLAPSCLMVYPYDGMDFSVIENAGIPLLYNTEYLELDPLGKAEWIKFVSLFFNKEEEANKVFAKIESEYNALKGKTAVIKNKPTIFSGTASRGLWHIAGGNSFAARFLKDAGCRYLWGSDHHNNIINLEFEAVFDKAYDADWWVIVSAEKKNYSLKDLERDDPRYAQFKAFKKKQILFCNVNETDYFGDGVAEPHYILADLVNFIHPGLLKDYNPRYFYRLK
jgi:iron complex transport system substrate-binding protein